MPPLRRCQRGGTSDGPRTSTGFAGCYLGAVAALILMRRSHGCKPGVVINPGTPVHMLDEVLEIVHHVLVMSVNPGFGGQKFIPGAIEKIRRLSNLRAHYNAGFRIEVDGGVEVEHAAELAQAGVNTLVAGTSIFHTPNPAESVRKMRKAALQALEQRV